MSSLHRCPSHPNHRLTGICAFCLQERLLDLLQSISPSEAESQVDDASSSAAAAAAAAVAGEQREEGSDAVEEPTFQVLNTAQETAQAERFHGDTENMPPIFQHHHRLRPQQPQHLHPQQQQQKQQQKLQPQKVPQLQQQHQADEEDESHGKSHRSRTQAFPDSITGFLDASASHQKARKSSWFSSSTKKEKKNAKPCASAVVDSLSAMTAAKTTTTTTTTKTPPSDHKSNGSKIGARTPLHYVMSIGRRSTSDASALLSGAQYSKCSYKNQYRDDYNRSAGNGNPNASGNAGIDHISLAGNLSSNGAGHNSKHSYSWISSLFHRKVKRRVGGGGGGGGGNDHCDVPARRSSADALGLQGISDGYGDEDLISSAAAASASAAANGDGGGDDDGGNVDTMGRLSLDGAVHLHPHHHHHHRLLQNLPAKKKLEEGGGEAQWPSSHPLHHHRHHHHQQQQQHLQLQGGMAYPWSPAPHQKPLPEEDRLCLCRDASSFMEASSISHARRSISTCKELWLQHQASSAFPASRSFHPLQEQEQPPPRHRPPQQGCCRCPAEATMATDCHQTLTPVGIKQESSCHSFFPRSRSWGTSAAGFGAAAVKDNSSGSGSNASCTRAAMIPSLSPPHHPHPTSASTPYHAHKLDPCCCNVPCSSSYLSPLQRHHQQQHQHQHY